MRRLRRRHARLQLQRNLGLIEQALAAHVMNEEAILAGLTAAERKQLAGLLRKLLIPLEDLR